MSGFSEVEMKNNGSKGSSDSRYLAALSTLLLNKPESPTFEEELLFVLRLNDEMLRELLDLSEDHHVTVRAVSRLQQNAIDIGQADLGRRLDVALGIEYKRIDNALRFLNAICHELESAGCPVTVIKSLDHWPDLGGDLDLYTSGERDTVVRVFTQKFGAELQPQSWGDRLANKWNFQIPGLPELVECHVKWLGQTGEQVALASRLEQRRVERQIGSYIFPVPAPEERIIVATLQRMYRHFYFRLCDIVNIADLVRSGSVNFDELRASADLGAIWPGVAGLLTIVAEYVKQYGGEPVQLTPEVLAASQINGKRTYVSEKFLRIPIVPEAAELYTRQMIGIGAQRNFRAMFRLSLLPALATAAFVGYRITGSDKGIW
jgi:hypothetical protein